MKKEEILKLTKEELEKEFNKMGILSHCLDCSDCSYCSDCSHCLDCSDCSYCSDCSHCLDCSDCSYCSDCSHCLECKNCKNLTNGLFCKNLKFDNKEDKYYILNIKVAKEEFENKLKEIKNE